MNSSVIHLLLLAVFSISVLGQTQDATYPMGVCDVVLDSDNEEVDNAVVSSTGGTTGPFGSEEVYSFADAGNGLTIDQINITGRLTTIAFYIKVNSQTSGEQSLFQFVDSDGDGLRVTLNGLTLQLSTTFKQATTFVAQSLLKVVDFTVTEGNWHAFSLLIFDGDSLIGLPIEGQFQARMDGSAPIVGTERFPKFVVGDLTINQFDGAISCFFVTNAEGSSTESAIALLENQCLNYAVDCPVAASTTTTEPSTAEPTTTPAGPLTPWCSIYNSFRNQLRHLRCVRRRIARRCRRRRRSAKWLCWQRFHFIWLRTKTLYSVVRSLRSSCQP